MEKRNPKRCRIKLKAVQQLLSAIPSAVAALVCSFFLASTLFHHKKNFILARNT